MKLSKTRTAIYISLGAAILFGIIGAVTLARIWFILAGLALLVEFVFSFGFLRCPHCGKHLDRTGMRTDITHCPFCGKELGE